MDDKELYLDALDIGDEEAFILEHYGTPRHSGRYPWGSGKNPQRSLDIITRNKDLKDKGVSEANRAKQILGKDATTDDLRAELDVASESRHIAGIYEARRWAEKGYSNIAIAKRTGLSEGTVRNYLREDALEKAKKITPLIDILKEEVDKKDYVQVGKGVESMLNVSEDKKKHALLYLKKQGYTVTNIQVQQAGSAGKTTIQVLAKPGTTYRDIVDNHIKDIKMPTDMCVAENLKTGEPEIKRVRPPVSIDSSRIFIRYRDEGGLERDGTIELRPGVEDLDLGNSHYAQVRVAVDNKYYLKGMAFKSDDIPDGYDVVYNVNKPKGTSVDKVFKKMKTEEQDPKAVFGALIQPQKDYISEKDGEIKQSALNVVRSEGEWADWSKNLPSQFLAKQSVPLAKQQLDLDIRNRKDELATIMSLTNPVVKRKFLEDFGDDCDGAAVHLKAASMPRQAYHVILPLTDIKENEIYAPNYSNGEKVCLIRFPHGGIFEIPELTVNNNRSPSAKKYLKNANDAVGIHARVAEQLSGADFDGDTVLVIPNRDNRIISSAPLDALKGFDSKEYKYPDGYSHPIVGEKKAKGGDGFKQQQEMGVVSNLIMDMTLHKAAPEDVANVTKYSMVVIDAVKHDLNWKQAKNDCCINSIRKKYRGDATSGASTLITKAKSEAHVDKRADAGIDPETGEKLYRPAKGSQWYDKEGNLHTKTQTSTKMYEAKDAMELLGDNPTEMELVYGRYANECKSMGNQARRLYVATQKPKRDPTMTKKYAAEVDSLKVKLNEAKKASVYEKQAQMLADTKFNALLAENPDMTKDEQKKYRGRCIVRARDELGFKKYEVKFTPKEWEAVQNNAISASMFEELLNKADMDVVRDLAMPRKRDVLSSSKVSRIKGYANSGYTQEEIANVLGISTSQVNKVLNNR